MIKLALGMIVFNGMPFVEGVLKTWYPYVDQIVVAEGPVKFWRDQGHICSTDGTLECLHKFNDPDGKLKILGAYYTMPWHDKLEMCNAWVEHVRDDITHVACFDADELMLREDIELVLALLEAGEYDSMGLRLYSFVGGFDRYLTGFEEKLEVIRIQPYCPDAAWLTHRPPTIGWPGKTKGKHLDWNTLDNLGVRLYHYSHVLPSQVKMKEKYYADRIGEKNVVPDYYKNVWLRWVKGEGITKWEVEELWKGIHDFHPRYRGEAFSKKFEGRHPWWIEKHRERILKIQREEML